MQANSPFFLCCFCSETEQYNYVLYSTIVNYCGKLNVGLHAIDNINYYKTKLRCYLIVSLTLDYSRL